MSTERSDKSWSAPNFDARLKDDGTVELSSPGPVLPGEMATITVSIDDLRSLAKEAKDWSTSWDEDKDTELMVGRVGAAIYQYRRVAISPIIGWVLESLLEDIEAAEEKKIEEGKQK